MPNAAFDPTKKVDFHNKKHFISGWPYRAVDTFVWRAGWVVNAAADKFHDVWLCTSLQAKQDLNKKGKPRARKSSSGRSQAQVDLGRHRRQGRRSKVYDTPEEAWTAFSAARKRLNLPRPSAVVRSGGGLQVWWISKTALLPHEWAPYAQGLKTLLLGDGFKFDPTCTADLVCPTPGTGDVQLQVRPPTPSRVVTVTS